MKILSYTFCFFRKRLTLALLFFSPAILALNLSDYVEISPGLYATITEEGNIVEIATTAEAVQSLEASKSNYSAKAQLIASKQNTRAPGLTQGPTLCTAFDTLQFSDFTLSTGFATLSGTASVQTAVGPAPAPPEFTYARVKVKLRTYDAAGNGIDKSVAIRRNPVLAGTNGCPTTNPISPNNSCYAFVEANTNIATAGATFINWVTKSEFVVDNPDADDMSGFGPSSNDCYDTATIRVISPLISL